MLQFIKYLAIVCLCIIIWNLEAKGATINASSCSVSAVQSAVKSASIGDTIMIPAGSCSWSTGPVTISIPIFLSGAGVGSTIITDNTAGAGLFYFSLNLSSSATYGASGMTIESTGTETSNGAFGVGDSSATGVASGIFHDLKFSNYPGRSFWINGGQGVIFNIWSDNCSMMIANPDSDAASNAAWNRSLTFGSGANTWYIEDSTFPFANGTEGVFDCGWGGQVVLRHSTISASSGSSFGGQFTENHGYDSIRRGCKLTEIYYNTFTNADPYTWMGIEFRGGTGVIWYNRLDSTTSWTAIGITNYRDNSGNTYAPPGDGVWCDGNQSVDGNTSPIGTYHGWPCRDQIGTGSGTPSTGNPQTLQPLYVWSNCTGANPWTYPDCVSGGGTLINATPFNTFSGTDYTSIHIVNGRDFYNNGSTPMPGYTAYPYPHPLRSGIVAPANLRIVP